MILSPPLPKTKPHLKDARAKFPGAWLLHLTQVSAPLKLGEISFPHSSDHTDHTDYTDHTEHTNYSPHSSLRTFDGSEVLTIGFKLVADMGGLKNSIPGVQHLFHTDHTDHSDHLTTLTILTTLTKVSISSPTKGET